MVVIIITVITQGIRVPSDLKGKLGGSLIANSGFFQAVGVISFGESFSESFSALFQTNKLTSVSICLSYVTDAVQSISSV
jgi:hypothetical protein